MQELTFINIKKKKKKGGGEWTTIKFSEVFEHILPIFSN